MKPSEVIRIASLLALLGLVVLVGSKVVESLQETIARGL